MHSDIHRISAFMHDDISITYQDISIIHLICKVFIKKFIQESLCSSVTRVSVSCVCKGGNERELSECDARACVCHCVWLGTAA